MSIVRLEWICFFETAQAKSVSKAAAYLRMPQPSVTKYIKKLENELSVSLFQRSNRGVFLTEIGRKLFESLSGLKDQSDQLMNTAIKSENEVVGLVKVGTHRILGLHYLPLVITTLQKKFKKLKFEIQLASSVEVSRLVSDGKLDYGLVANPLPLAGLITKKIAEEFVAVFSSKKDHKIDGAKIYYNPEMQNLNSILSQLKNCDLRAIPDYDLLAELALHDKDSGALLPNSVAIRSKLHHQVSPVFYKANIGLIFRSEAKNYFRHPIIINSFST